MYVEHCLDMHQSLITSGNCGDDIELSHLSRATRVGGVICFSMMNKYREIVGMKVARFLALTAYLFPFPI